METTCPGCGGEIDERYGVKGPVEDNRYREAYCSTECIDTAARRQATLQHASGAFDRTSFDNDAFGEGDPFAE